MLLTWRALRHVLSKLSSDSNVFFGNETILDEVKSMSVLFDDPKSLCDSLSVVREYSSAAVFLGEINENLWMIKW
jgi:hypothetical protein